MTREAAPDTWTEGPLPANLVVGSNALITDLVGFKRFYSTCDPALVIGASCTMERVHFAMERRPG